MYDLQLAWAILEKLRSEFPRKLHLHQLQAELPEYHRLSHGDWLSAVHALGIDGLISGEFLHEGTSIADAAAMHLTELGRSRLRENRPILDGKMVVARRPVLEFSDFGEIGFRSSDDPQLYPPRGLAFFVHNAEQRFETSADNLNCSLSMRSVAGEELFVEAAPWFKNSADVPFGHFFFQTTSLGMLERAGVVSAIFRDSRFYSALYADNTSPKEGQLLRCGEWQITLRIEGNNVRRTFQGKLVLLPNGSASFVPIHLVERPGDAHLLPDTYGPSSAPRAFITYSWDSPEHRTWVEQLAARLRGNGVDTILDRWNLRPGHDRFAFMESSIAESDFVLIVCTPEYADKANDRTGGVGYEATIITPELAGKVRQTKFIPILREGDWDNTVPRWLKSRIGFDLRGTEYDQAQYEALLRHLHNATDGPPPIGRRPDFEIQCVGSGREFGNLRQGARPSYGNRDLSPKEIELLWTAAQDPSGEILHSKTIEGEGLRTNGLHFLSNADVRSAVEWLEAFRSLEQRSFIEPLNQTRDFFRLTARGYEAADHLDGFRRWNAEAAVLRAHYFNAPPQEHTISCKGIIVLPPTYFDSDVSDADAVMRSVKEPRTLVIEGVDSAPQIDWSPTEIEFIDANTGSTQYFRVREIQAQRRCIKLPLED